MKRLAMLRALTAMLPRFCKGSQGEWKGGGGALTREISSPALLITSPMYAFNVG